MLTRETGLLSKWRGRAILARRGSEIEYIEGDIVTVDSIASIPIPRSDESCVLAVIPFRQIAERGYTCHDDGLGIQVLIGDKMPQVCQQSLDGIGGEPFHLSGLRFEPDDLGFESLVADVIDREIGGGSGSNFVIHRRLHAQADTTRINWLEDGAQTALANLMSRDPNAYWRFWICLPELSLIGSSPELHLGYESGQVWMTPMSGTLRVDHSTDRDAIEKFIESRKEFEELFMVLDEELKMLCGMTPSSVTVSGPKIDIFDQVIHTYFEIRADTTLSMHDALTQSLFAPTVIGSPLREAFDVIARSEVVPTRILRWSNLSVESARLCNHVGFRNRYSNSVYRTGRPSLDSGRRHDSEAFNATRGDRGNCVEGERSDGGASG